MASQGKSEFLIQKKLIEKEDSIIVSGTVSQGYIKKNQLLWIGPFLNGRFRETRVQSIHCYKIEVKKSNCGQSCSIAFQVTGAIKKSLQTSTIRSGMVLVESHSEPKGVMEFLADFKLCDDNDTEQTCPPAYQPVVTSSSFRQCCTILPSGDKPIPSPPPKKPKKDGSNKEGSKFKVPKGEPPSKTNISKLEIFHKEQDESNGQGINSDNFIEEDGTDLNWPSLARWRSKSKDDAN